MPGFIGQGKVQFFDNNNTFLSGGQVWVYLPESTTPTNTYTDILSAINGTNPQPNPVPLNSRGEAIIVIDGPVDLVVEDANIDPSTGHGNVIWTIPNFSVADAEEAGMTGTYHLLNNTIADSNNNPAFAFDAVANAINMVYITSSTGNLTTPPTIAAITSTGSNDMDLYLKGQNAGAVRVASLFKVTAPSTSTTLNVIPSADLGTPTYITTSGTGNNSLCIQATGSGTVDVKNNFSITAAGVQAGNFSVAGTSTLTGATTTSTLTASTSIVSNGLLKVQNTGATAKYSNIQFLGTTADRTFQLPDFTCQMPQTDGAANDPIVTNGAGVLSLGTTGIAIKNGAFRNTILPGTLAGNVSVALPNVTTIMPQGLGAANQYIKTDGAGNWTYTHPIAFGCVNVVCAAGQTIPAGQVLTATLDTKNYDPSNVFSLSPNFYYNPQRAGYYKISYQHSIASGACTAYLQRETSGVWATVQTIIPSLAVTTGNPNGSGTCINQLPSVGDKFRIVLDNDFAGNTNVLHMLATFQYLGS